MKNYCLALVNWVSVKDKPTKQCFNNRLSVSACKAIIIIAGGSSSSCSENAVVEMLLAVKETRGSKYYQVQIINEPNHNPSEKKMVT